MRIDILAPHILRLYCWGLLESNEVLAKVPGKSGVSLIPIAPVSDEPDLRDAGKPYIIYGFAENENIRVPWIHTGILSFRIIAPTFSDLSKIVGVLTTALEIEDEAAANVNLWSSKQPAFAGCRFTGVCGTYVEAADAPEQEGGPLEGVVNIRYAYVVEKQVKTFEKVTSNPDVYDWV